MEAKFVVNNSTTKTHPYCVFWFTKLGYCFLQVLWRYKGKKPDTLGSNTRLFDWIPQNDLLGKTVEGRTLYFNRWTISILNNCLTTNKLKIFNNLNTSHFSFKASVFKYLVSDFTDPHFLLLIKKSIFH